MNWFTVSGIVWSMELFEFVLSELEWELGCVNTSIFDSGNEDGCCGTEEVCAKALRGSFFCLTDVVRAKKNKEY